MNPEDSTWQDSPLSSPTFPSPAATTMFLRPCDLLPSISPLDSPVLSPSFSPPSTPLFQPTPHDTKHLQSEETNDSIGTPTMPSPPRSTKLLRIGPNGRYVLKFIQMLGLLMFLVWQMCWQM